MGLTRTTVLVLAAVAGVACEEAIDEGPAADAAQLRLADITLVPCITWLDSGELECPDLDDHPSPPPEGTRAYDLVGGWTAWCGLEGRREDRGTPTTITCWQAWDVGEPIDYGADELNPPQDATFTSISGDPELDMCAAGPGVPPVCWGHPPDTQPQPRAEIATRTDVVGMTYSPCDLCILTADGVVTCNATEPVRGIDDCAHPLGDQAFTAIDGNEYGVCGVTTAGGLLCAERRKKASEPYASEQYAWNSAIPAGVQWASFVVGWEGGCGLSTAGEAVCFGTRHKYCEGGDFGDCFDLTAWYRHARFDGVYDKVVPGYRYVYALRPNGELELHWDPDCATYDDGLPWLCPPDPSIWEALGYEEPVHAQELPEWVPPPWVPTPQ